MDLKSTGGLAPAPDSSPLTFALAYVRVGIPVLPLHTPDGRDRCSCSSTTCSSSGKHPRTVHGVKDASTDEGQIRRWWEDRWPEANIGLVTGQASGFFVVDVDGEEGADQLMSLELDRGEIPQTVRVQTGSGEHLYFTLPSNQQISNSAGRLEDGLDVRGEGGYVVAPPSLHPSGQRYRWIDGRAADPDKIAAPPDWLVGLIADQRSGGNHETADPLPEAIHKGRRNNTLTRFAGALRRMGLTGEEIFDHLRLMNQSRCRPQLPEGEVRRLAHGMERYEPEDPLAPHRVCVPVAKGAR